MHVQLLPVAALPPSNAADDLAAGRVFWRREWLAAVLENYETSDPRAPAVCDEQGRLVGLAPWRRRTTTVRGTVVEFLGQEELCLDYPTVLAAPSRRDEITAALASWLLDEVHGEWSWDALRLEHVAPADPAIESLVGALALRGAHAIREPALRCWRLALPESWEAYLAANSKSHRKQLRRASRTHLESGDCRLHVAASLEEFRAGFEILINLHQRRRRMLGQPGCFASPRFQNCLWRASESLLACGVTRLYWLTRGEQPIAAELHFEEAGVSHAYQAGVEPEALEMEPGRLIQIAIIQRLIQQGATAVDFLRGDEPYKAHWRAEPIGLTTLTIPAPRTSSQIRQELSNWGESAKGWIKDSLTAVGLLGPGGAT